MSNGKQTLNWRLLGRLTGAGLLAVTGAIHLDLYLTGYRSIPTIGWLFLLQVISAFALAVAVVVIDSSLVAAAGALFAASTLGGYLLSMWVGLFGFKEVRTTAGILAGLIEVAAFAVLGLVAVTPRREPAAAAAGTRTSSWLRRPGGALLWLAVAGASVVALALLGGVLASSGGAASASNDNHPELKAMQVGGAVVLTNAKGFTLYWFAPDTPTTSRCYSTCAAYWPPVLGTPSAGPGVTGKLGTVTRTGGGVQATYDGHPLYSYIGDTGPGEANGNGINLNGGLWHEVTVSAG